MATPMAEAPASKAIVKRRRLRILASFVSNSRLEDRGLMSLNQSVSDEFTKRGQERISGFFGFDELNTDRQMFLLGEAALSGMRPVMAAESRRRPDQRGA